MPANLQGIWSESLEPIWKCGYTMNINLQMNYWGAEQAGLSECVEPLISFVSRLKTSGEKPQRKCSALTAGVLSIIRIYGI